VALLGDRTLGSLALALDSREAPLRLVLGAPRGAVSRRRQLGQGCGFLDSRAREHGFARHGCNVLNLLSDRSGKHRVAKGISDQLLLTQGKLQPLVLRVVGRVGR